MRTRYGPPDVVRVDDVQTATLDEPDRMPAPEAIVQVAERIGWAKDLHSLPEHQRYPGQ